jgi:hypothetical protein
MCRSHFFAVGRGGFIDCCFQKRRCGPPSFGEFVATFLYIKSFLKLKGRAHVIVLEKNLLTYSPKYLVTTWD